MLSKQVKQRIAYNKTKRQVPGWKREMRAFFISQLPPAQSILSSKHFVVKVSVLGDDVLTQEYQNKQADETFNKITTWTRHDWHAYIRSGDEAYAQYVDRRARMLSAYRYRRAVVLPADPEQLAKDFEGDMLNDLAACECGLTIGEHNLGVVCKACNTEVRHPTLRPPTLDIYGRESDYKKFPDIDKPVEGE